MAMAAFGGVSIPAVLFLIAVAVLLAILICFYFYINEIACCASVPRLFFLKREEVRVKELAEDTEDLIVTGYGGVQINNAFEVVSDISSTTVPEEFNEQEKLDLAALDLDSDEEDDNLEDSCFVECEVIFEVETSELKLRMLGTDNVPAALGTHFQMSVATVPIVTKHHKTKMIKGPDPDFTEEFYFGFVQPDILEEMGMRFRLYSCERRKRDKLLYEGTFSLIELIDEKGPTIVKLQPSTRITQHSLDLAHDDEITAMSVASDDEVVQPGFVPPSSKVTVGKGSKKVMGQPSLNIRMAYNKSAGRLRVSVIKGAFLLPHPRSRTLKGPDTFIKLELLGANGRPMSESRTTVRFADHNPLYMEKYIFQMAYFQVTDCTLMVRVYQKKSTTGKALLGWFALGKDSSGEEERKQWEDMLNNKGNDVAAWHTLIPEEK